MSRSPDDRFAGVLDFVTALAGIPVSERAPVAAQTAVAVDATAPSLAQTALPFDATPVASAGPAPQPAPMAESAPAAEPVAAAAPQAAPMAQATPPPAAEAPPTPKAEPEPISAPSAAPVAQAAPPPAAEAPPTPKPEPVPDAAVATAKPAAPETVRPRPPLLFVERMPKRRVVKHEDEEADDATAAKTKAKQSPEHVRDDEDEDEEKETADREPVLLWRAPREDGAPAEPIAADGGSPEPESDRRSPLLMEKPLLKVATATSRAARQLGRLLGRWRTLPRNTRIGSGATAALLVLALVWWRVARGHEERGPDWVGERPPAELTESTAPRPATRGAEPRPPRSSTSGTTPRSTPAAGATPATATRPDAAAPPRPTAGLSDPAHLYINSNPWGVLYIDDRLIGNVPQADVKISPGMHRIRITRDGFLSYETEIAIEAGETLRLTDIILQEKPQ
jgi:hypothetical protein